MEYWVFFVYEANRNVLVNNFARAVEWTKSTRTRFGFIREMLVENEKESLRESRIKCQSINNPNNQDKLFFQSPMLMNLLTVCNLHEGSKQKQMIGNYSLEITSHSTANASFFLLSSEEFSSFRKIAQATKSRQIKKQQKSV